MLNLVDAIHAFSNHQQEAILRITRFCNQRCRFCFTEIDNVTTVPYEEIVHEVDRIIESYTSSEIGFTITGGEPLLHPDLLKIVDYIYSNKCFVTIQSNAVVLWSQRTLLSRLEQYKDGLIFFVSYHAHSAPTYDMITGTHGQYSLATEGIKNILRTSHQVVINTVVNALNIRHLGEYFHFLGKEFQSISPNMRINISVISNIYKSHNTDSLLVRYSDITRIINISEPIISHYELRIQYGFWWPCWLPYCVARTLNSFQDTPMFYRLERKEYAERVKLDDCSSCKYEGNCSGISRAYLEKFWKEEFHPVLGLGQESF